MAYAACKRGSEQFDNEHLSVKLCSRRTQQPVPPTLARTRSISVPTLLQAKPARCEGRRVACGAAGVAEATPKMTMSSGGAGKRVMIVGALLLPCATTLEPLQGFVGRLSGGWHAGRQLWVQAACARRWQHTSDVAASVATASATRALHAAEAGDTRTGVADC